MTPPLSQCTSTALATSLVLLGAACTAPPAPPSAHVQFGAMRAVMREGHTEARTRLADLDLGPGAIAVGALAGLAGEITAVDGEVHVATATAEHGVDRAASADDAATLLTVARPAHVTRLVAETPLDEAALKRLAATRHPVDEPGEHAVDTRPVVALAIRGTTRRLALHVARGTCPHEDTDPEHAPWRWAADPHTPVRLVGFWAPDRAGELTHHGTEFHLHAIVATATGTISGHVDEFELEPGATLEVGDR